MSEYFIYEKNVVYIAYGRGLLLFTHPIGPLPYNNDQLQAGREVLLRTAVFDKKIRNAMTRGSLL
jgi:hypothetical protein